MDVGYWTQCAKDVVSLVIIICIVVAAVGSAIWLVVAAIAWPFIIAEQQRKVKQHEQDIEERNIESERATREFTKNEQQRIANEEWEKEKYRMEHKERMRALRQINALYENDELEL